jgi:hypothetical protein
VQEPGQHIGGRSRGCVVAEAAQVDEELAVGEPRRDLVRPVHSERGLADAGWARHRADDHGGRMLAGTGQQGVEPREVLGVSGEVPHRQRQLRRDRTSHRNSGNGDRRRREVECRVLAEDRGLQLTQALAGVEPQILLERAFQPVIHDERIRRTLGPILREHQLRVEPLVVWVVPCLPLQLRDELRVLTEVQLVLNEGLPDQQPEVLQSFGLDIEPGPADDVLQRTPSPQRKRVTQLPYPGRSSESQSTWSVADDRRLAFVEAHLESLTEAMAAGVDVRGQTRTPATAIAGSGVSWRCAAKEGPFLTLSAWEGTLANTPLGGGQATEADRRAAASASAFFLSTRGKVSATPSPEAPKAMRSRLTTPILVSARDT